jgi:hypothetical protein
LQLTVIGYTRSAGKPSAQKSLVATTSANTSRLPVAGSPLKYFTRIERPSGVMWASLFVARMPAFRLSASGHGDTGPWRPLVTGHRP